MSSPGGHNYEADLGTSVRGVSHVARLSSYRKKRVKAWFVICMQRGCFPDLAVCGLLHTVIPSCMSSTTQNLGLLVAAIRLFSVDDLVAACQVPQGEALQCDAQADALRPQYRRGGPGSRPRPVAAAPPARSGDAALFEKVMSSGAVKPDAFWWYNHMAVLGAKRGRRDRVLHNV